MQVSVEWVVELIFLCIVHWILAGIVVNDIAKRKHVKGNHKAPWVIVVLLLTFFGSLLYIMFHPQMVNGDEE